MLKCFSPKCCLLGLSLGLLLNWGCGSAEDPATAKMRAKLVPVSGTVQLNGKPLDGVLVSYLVEADTQEGEAASGITDVTGKYSLSTYLGGSQKGMAPGAVPSSYRVTITKLVMPDGSPVPSDVTDADAEAMQAKQLLPGKYSHAAQTQLKAIVSAEPSVNDFDLKAK